ncbi:MAG: hypothetical protein AB1606_04075 [Nitrospirota bacterium]
MNQACPFGLSGSAELTEALRTKPGVRPGFRTIKDDLMRQYETLNPAELKREIQNYKIGF